MDQLIFLVEEAPEGGHTAALGASTSTGADDAGGPGEVVRDAVRCHPGDGRPTDIRLVKSKDFVG